MRVIDEIGHITAVLRSRGVNVDAMLIAHAKDRSTQAQILQSLVGALYDGLAYGNWPATSKLEEET